MKTLMPSPGRNFCRRLGCYTLLVLGMPPLGAGGLADAIAELLLG